MNNTIALRLEAQQLIAFLTFPEAVAKLGETVAFSERLLLKITLGNIDSQAEAQERLQAQIERIQKKLGAE